MVWECPRETEREKKIEKQILYSIAKFRRTGFHGSSRIRCCQSTNFTFSKIGSGISLIKKLKSVRLKEELWGMPKSFLKKNNLVFLFFYQFH